MWMWVKSVRLYAMDVEVGENVKLYATDVEVGEEC